MLKTRLLTAVVLLVAFLSALVYLPASGWRNLCLALVGLGGWEWARFAGTAHVAGRVGYGAVLVAVTGALLWRLLPDNWVIVGHQVLFIANALLWLVCIPLILQRTQPLPKWMMLVLGVIVLVPTALAMAAIRVDFGWRVLVACMAVAWVADTAAYFTGKRFGRVKLAPAVSPGKTREGAFGALIAGAAYGAVMGAVAAPAEAMPTAKVMWMVGLALFAVWLTVCSILGDLLESWCKRQVGLKDSGAIFPGHGGLLDRIDSLTAVLPMCIVACWVVMGVAEFLLRDVHLAP